MSGRFLQKRQCQSCLDINNMFRLFGSTNQSLGLLPETATLMTISLGPGSGIGLSLISTFGPAATMASFILSLLEVEKSDPVDAVAALREAGDCRDRLQLVRISAGDRALRTNGIVKSFGEKSDVDMA